MESDPSSYGLHFYHLYFMHSLTCVYKRGWWPNRTQISTVPKGGWYPHISQLKIRHDATSPNSLSTYPLFSLHGLADNRGS